MQILEAEINLRENTRIAERAKEALPTDEFERTARELSEVQQGVATRVDKVIDRIAELPKAAEEFGKEMALLEHVLAVMDDATAILSTPETGAPAIAAETEAIELLLQSKRINPGGGGGGASPGGGGGGTTSDAALALLGKGANEKEIREDHRVQQSVGDAGPSLPEEFRQGLDQYFNRLGN